MAGFRLRTQQVVSENKALYERLKENTPPNEIARNRSEVKVSNDKYIFCALSSTFSGFGSIIVLESFIFVRTIILLCCAF